MQLWINGQARDLTNLTGEATVEGVIVALGIKVDRVAVEQNGEIVPRAGWAGAAVHSGDRFEIVQFVGGGRC